MDLLWFRDLSNLARTGHFSRAAEISNVSQPAFSRRIKAVEAWVGVSLIDRSRHPIRLTTAGAQILEAGEQALDRLETERREILKSHALPENCIVTFGAQHSIGWRFFPSWLRAFETAFGPIISRLRADDLPSCVQDLVSRNVDFVVAYSSAHAAAIDDVDGLESVRIGRDSLVPVSKRQPDGTPLFRLSSYAGVQVPYLQFGPDAPISRHLEPLLMSNDLLGRLGVVYQNSMAGALRIRARDGAGIAWLPHSLVAPDLDNLQLTTIGPPDWAVELEIRLYRIRDHTNELTRAMWSFLLDTTTPRPDRK